MTPTTPIRTDLVGLGLVSHFTLHAHTLIEPPQLDVESPSHGRLRNCSIIAA